MKPFLLLFLLALISPSYAQNQISTPTGQPLRINSNNVIIKQKISLESDSGYVSIGSHKFLGLKKHVSGGLSSFLGPGSGNNSMSGIRNTFVGENTGKANTTGYDNLFMGSLSGQANSSGYGNTMLGSPAGQANTSGYFNTFVGSSSGNANVSGNSNVHVGYTAGNSSNATNNVYIGRAAGYFNTTGVSNVYIGFGAGAGNGAQVTTGSRNVFIGNQAGYTELGSNKLYIANSSTTSPLIYGEFPTTSPAYVGKLVFNTRVGIGITAFPDNVMVNNVPTDVSGFKMFVNGGFVTKQLVITGDITWADYVFDDNYKLKSLDEVEEYIKQNGHLPNIPSAANVETWGINVGQMARLQQEKIEELTLYLIDQNKQIHNNDLLIKQLDMKVSTIEAAVNNIKTKSGDL